MKFFLSSLILALLSASLCSAAQNAAVPAVCNAYLRFKKCYTETVTVQPTCGIRHCPMIPAIVCPEIIKVATKIVPCKRQCCPVTPTVTKTATCPGCPTGCVIPTSTITSTLTCGHLGPVTPAPVAARD